MPHVPSSGYRATRSIQCHPNPYGFCKTSACVSFGCFFPPVSFLHLHREHPAEIDLGLCSFHRVPPRLQGNPKQTNVGSLGCVEDHLPHPAAHLRSARVAPHPRVELVVLSFVLTAQAVDQAQWYDALALQEAVFVPPLQSAQ